MKNLKPYTATSRQIYYTPKKIYLWNNNGKQPPGAHLMHAKIKARGPTPSQKPPNLNTTELSTQTDTQIHTHTWWRLGGGWVVVGGESWFI